MSEPDFTRLRALMDAYAAKRVAAAEAKHARDNAMKDLHTAEAEANDAGLALNDELERLLKERPAIKNCVLQA